MLEVLEWVDLSITLPSFGLDAAKSDLPWPSRPGLSVWPTGTSPPGDVSSGPVDVDHDPGDLVIVGRMTGVHSRNPDPPSVAIGPSMGCPSGHPSYHLFSCTFS